MKAQFRRSDGIMPFILTTASANRPMTPQDHALLQLLKANARESTAELARKLGLSRTTVQDRIRRLERDGVIAGYTVRLDGQLGQRQIRAEVLLNVNPKQTER